MYRQYLTLKIDNIPIKVIPNNTPSQISANELRAIYSPVLADNGLHNWQIATDETLPSNVLGCCDYPANEILINPLCYYLMDFQQVRQILYHEVAHALCPNDDHNAYWQSKCLEIGGNGLIKTPYKSLKIIDKQRQIYEIRF